MSEETYRPPLLRCRACDVPLTDSPPEPLRDPFMGAGSFVRHTCPSCGLKCFTTTYGRRAPAPPLVWVSQTAPAPRALPPLEVQGVSIVPIMEPARLPVLDYIALLKARCLDALRVPACLLGSPPPVPDTAALFPYLGVYSDLRGSTGPTRIDAITNKKNPYYDAMWNGGAGYGSGHLFGDLAAFDRRARATPGGFLVKPEPEADNEARADLRTLAARPPKPDPTATAILERLNFLTSHEGRHVEILEGPGTE